MNFTKISSVAGATALATVVNLAPAMAASPGQLGGGPDVYKVKNVTQNGSYANTASAACGEELKYSIRLHNTEFGALNNIVVSANLASGSVTATPDSGASAGTSGNVTVSLPSGASQSYESGSTVLYDANGNVIKTLADGITAGGVNVGTLNGSTTEFVNFKTKVNCPQTPVTPTTPTTPAALPATGPEGLLGATAGTGILGYAVMQYRRSRKALADKLRNVK